MPRRAFTISTKSSPHHRVPPPLPRVASSSLESRSDPRDCVRPRDHLRPPCLHVRFSSQGVSAPGLLGLRVRLEAFDEAFQQAGTLCGAQAENLRFEFVQWRGHRTPRALLKLKDATAGHPIDAGDSSPTRSRVAAPMAADMLWAQRRARWVDRSNPPTAHPSSGALGTFLWPASDSA